MSDGATHFNSELFEELRVNFVRSCGLVPIHLGDAAVELLQREWCVAVVVDEIVSDPGVVTFFDPSVLFGGLVGTHFSILCAKSISFTAAGDAGAGGGVKGLVVVLVGFSLKLFKHGPHVLRVLFLNDSLSPDPTLVVLYH